MWFPNEQRRPEERYRETEWVLTKKRLPRPNGKLEPKEEARQAYVNRKRISAAWDLTGRDPDIRITVAAPSDWLSPYVPRLARAYSVSGGPVCISGQRSCSKDTQRASNYDPIRSLGGRLIVGS